jgi:hypothetical protein
VPGGGGVGLDGNGDPVRVAGQQRRHEDVTLGVGDADLLVLETGGDAGDADAEERAGLLHRAGGEDPFVG